MKTKNLTFVEAIDAMRRGECVRASNGAHEGNQYREHLGRLLYWDDVSWCPSVGCDTTAEFDIIPDPSKPKPKQSTRLWDEYVETFGDPREGEKMPAFVHRGIVLDRAKKLADYILARTREELANEKY